MAPSEEGAAARADCRDSPVSPARDTGKRPFRRVAIVGVGLIGGSLGLALRERGLAGSVTGIDVDAATRALAVERGCLDETSDCLSAVSGADIVVFAVPVGVMPDLMTRTQPHIDSDALVTDVGSVKRRIVAEGWRLFGERFVGGHPMAGSEQSGAASARADLFVGASWAIVPPAGSETAQDAASRIEMMATGVGGRPVRLTAERHDHIAALVSHLPHAISFSYTRIVAETDARAAADIAGASYRDLTRIAASERELWADILLENRDETLAAIGRFEAALEELRGALASRDRGAVNACLATARGMPES